MKRACISLARASHPCRRVYAAPHFLTAPAPAGLHQSLQHSSSSRTIISVPSMAIFKFHYYSVTSSKPASTTTSQEAASTSSAARPLGEYRFLTGVCSIPHPSKVIKGGEDAHFVSSDGKVIGVADGVGGWNDQGVDPALYSRALMEGSRAFCEENISIFDPEQEEKIRLHDPSAIIYAGYTHASKIVGSSTCCVCVLEGHKLLVANLGDSGFTIIRRGKVHYSSLPQQHAFNFPYQLGSESSDKPEHSELFEKKIEPGDVIVAATDGLFDNVSPETITRIIADWNLSATDIAEKIGAYARTQAEKRTGDTPFAIMAQNNGYRFKGGKLDDITIVVGIVIEGTPN